MWCTLAAENHPDKNDKASVAMIRVCPVCYAAPLPVDSASCPSCPGELESSGERRTLTVLFADLARSVKFSASHDAEVVAYVQAEIDQRAREIFASHGGLLNQIVGDEFMGLFGYPTPHDDDAIRCVRAARALHAMVRELSDGLYGHLLTMHLYLHSGCATGEVVIKRSASDNLGGIYLVKGNTVNLAARARENARADELLCCQATYGAIAGYFVCAPPQPVMLRGVDEPVELSRIEAPTGVRRRFDVAIRRGLTRWVGRERELEVLDAHLVDAAAGRGHCVVISGEAGVGKTRLAHQFNGRVPAARHTSIAGYCHADVKAPAFGPLIDALGEALQLEPESNLVDRQRTVEARISALDASLVEFLPHLLMLFDLRSERHRLNEQLPEEVVQAQFQEALTRTFQSLARQRPLVVTLDDWQWADGASQRWLAACLPTLHRVPLLFVVLTRPMHERDWRPLPNVTLLGLESLTPEQTQAVFCDVVNATELPAGLDLLVHEHTGGNALFVEEVARQMLESRELAIEQGRARLHRPVTELSRPALVESVIQARIALLGWQARDTLKVGAVIGRSFDVDVLTQVSPSPQVVPAALADLVARDFIHQVTVEAPVRYRFKHVVTQRATYQTLLRTKRSELHGRVAQALETLRAERLSEHYEALAHHCREANLVEKAVTYLGHAADRAGQLYQTPQAMDHYLEAIELMDRGPMNDGLKRLRVEFALALGRRAFIKPSPRVYAILLKSHQFARDLAEPWLEAQAALTLGNVSWLESRFDDAHRHLRDAMQIAAVHRYATLGAAAEGAFGHTMFYRADFATGIDHLEQAATRLRAGRNRVLLHNVHNYLALQYAFTGRFAAAYALQKDIVADAAETGHRFIEQATRLWSSLGKAQQGEWQDACALAEAVIDIGDTTDARYMAAYAHCSRGHARFFLGPEHLDGLCEFEDGLGALYALGHHLAISMYEGWFAEACALVGDADRAQTFAERALARSAQGEFVGEVAARRALALAQASRPAPDWALADRQLARALEVAPQRWQFPDEAVTRFRQAELLALRGAFDDARQALAQAAQGFASLAMSDWWQHSVERLSNSLKRGFPPATFVPYCQPGTMQAQARQAPAVQGGQEQTHGWA